MYTIRRNEMRVAAVFRIERERGIRGLAERALQLVDDGGIDDGAQHLATVEANLDPRAVLSQR